MSVDAAREELFRGASRSRPPEVVEREYRQYENETRRKTSALFQGAQNSQQLPDVRKREYLQYLHQGVGQGSAILRQDANENEGRKRTAFDLDNDHSLFKHQVQIHRAQVSQVRVILVFSLGLMITLWIVQYYRKDLD